LLVAEDDGSDRWVVVPALRPPLGMLFKPRRRSGAVGHVSASGELQRACEGEVAVAVGVVVEVPVVVGVDRFAAAGAGAFAGVDGGAIAARRR
jgi:hypothetical protein